MALTLVQLRALAAVVDEGTFTDAATALGTSQASVSRAVAALESEVGLQLLDRGHGAVRVTVGGRDVLEHARRVLAEVEAITDLGRRGGRRLRLGYAWSALGVHTTPVQRRWAREQPGCALQLVPSNTPTAGLLEGLVDVAVLRRPPGGGRFRAEQVGTEDRFAALAEDHPLAAGRTVTLAALAECVVAVDQRTGTTDAAVWAGAGTPPRTRPVHGVEEWLTVVAAGHAVGMTAASTTHQHPRPGVVYRRVLDAPPVPVWLCWWRRHHSPEVADLVDVVTDAYRSGTGAGRGARGGR